MLRDFISYWWLTGKRVLCTLFLSGCLTYGVENYNPAYYSGEETPDEQ